MTVNKKKKNIYLKMRIIKKTSKNQKTQNQMLNQNLPPSQMMRTYLKHPKIENQSSLMRRTNHSTHQILIRIL